jgi:tetratricopeptide (TPR) repeat protein
MSSAARRIRRIQGHCLLSCAHTLGEEVLSDLSVSELKRRLKSRGIRLDDCLTKKDLIDRLLEWLPHAVSDIRPEVRASPSALTQEEEARLLQEIQQNNYERRKAAEDKLLDGWATERGVEAQNVISYVDKLMKLDRNFDKAKELLLQLADRHDTWAEPQARLGVVLLEHQPEEALKMCQLALQLRGCHFKALRTLVKCHLAMGDIDQAKEAVAQLQPLQPQIAEALTAVLAQIESFLEENGFTENSLSDFIGRDGQVDMTWYVQKLVDEID